MSGRRAIGRGRGRGADRAVAAVPAPGGTASRAIVQAGKEREMVWDTDTVLTAKDDRPLISLVERPKEPSHNGQKIPVRVNFFQVLLNYRGPLHIYDVHFQTVRDSKPLLPDQKRAVVWNCLRDSLLLESFVTDAPNFAYDGASCLFALQQLPTGHEVFMDKGSRMSVTVPGEYGTTFFTMRMKLADTVNIVSDTNPKQLFIEAGIGPKATTLTLIDAVIRQYPTHPFLQENFVSIGNNFYRKPDTNNQPSIDLGGGRYSLYGGSVNTSLGLNGKTYINVDRSNAVFYKPMSCIEFMVHALNEAESTTTYRLDCLAPDTALDDTRRDNLRNYLKGLKCDMTYFPDQHKNRTRTVTKIGQSARDTMFRLRESESEVSVESYFQSHHSINLKYPMLPVIVFGSGKRISFVPIELLKITPYQRCTRTLPEAATTIMIKQLCTNAPALANKISDVVGASNLGEDKWSQTFQVAMNKEMELVHGRILEAPTIEHGDNKKEKPFNGVWANRNPPPVLRRGQWTGVVVARLCRDRDLSNDAVKNAIGQLFRVAHESGYPCTERDADGIHIVNLDPRTDLEIGFNKEITPAIQQSGANLVIVVMPNRNAQQYGTIKRLCDTRLNIPTQCLLLKTCKPLKPMTAYNVLLKINVKLSGWNWLINNPRPSVDLQDTMIMGIDVAHPGGRDKRIPSLAAVVGSLENFGRYGASVTVNRGSKEIINYVYDAMLERLDHYHSVNGRFPKSIIVFRDGVSQNSFQDVLTEELNSLREAARLKSDTEPKFTFIVCQKRHHTRLFCDKPQQECGKAKNVPPGTIVDTDVVDSELFDYYLCSHYGIQGTSRPCHYTVLVDDSKHSADFLQQLSYELCHLYARCTRSVSIPAPVYYADKVADRAKSHLLDYLAKLPNDQSPQTTTQLSERVKSMEKLVTVTNEMMATMYFC